MDNIGNYEYRVLKIANLRRKKNYFKALRKKRLSDQIYPHVSSTWHYYDNLHQYSKNKIHCSCSDCSTKTRNKGHKRCWQKSINYSMADIRKILRMDNSMEEYTGNKIQRKV